MFKYNCFSLLLYEAIPLYFHIQTWKPADPADAIWAGKPNDGE